MSELRLPRLAKPPDRGEPGFVCPRCSKPSWHPEDARHGYCASCSWWTGGPDPLPHPDDEIQEGP